jgi:hypothetical protein
MRLPQLSPASKIRRFSALTAASSKRRLLPSFNDLAEGRKPRTETAATTSSVSLIEVSPNARRVARDRLFAV